MSTTSTTIRWDDQDKRKFEQVVNSLGMNVSTAFNVFVKATIRSQGIPFALVADSLDNPQIRTQIRQELESRLALDDDPDTKWYSTDEVKKTLRI